MDLMRAMLDDLMGRDRNAVNEEQAKKSYRKYYEPEVCKFYLLEMCPHDLFPNTKVDLGKCSKLHDRYLLDDFKKLLGAQDKSAEKDFITYEEDLYRELLVHVTELDRSIKRKLERVDISTPEPLSIPVNLDDETIKERVKLITERKKVITSEMEKLAEQGKVAESQNLVKIIDQLDADIRSLQNRSNKVERRMIICDVCGAYLSTADDDKRTDCHTSGKQHLGFLRIREKLEQLKAAGRDRGKTRDSRREHDHDRDRGRDRDRDRDRDHGRDRNRDRDRDHGRDRDRD
eukprot:TRINITY_DN783_c0_g2_i7.p1 TRINITY_DN783_c0_g2~~TRINITY_DN783_c0_g2_i7.p1  ORF type:complete len:289 (-),score=59.34 TRINITY_DN783_c0_g2_i7:194-1060(-)